MSKNWVHERTQYSLESVFAALKRQMESDVQQFNDLDNSLRFDRMFHFKEESNNRQFHILRVSPSLQGSPVYAPIGACYVSGEEEIIADFSGLGATINSYWDGLEGRGFLQVQWRGKNMPSEPEKITVGDIWRVSACFLAPKFF